MAIGHQFADESIMGSLDAGDFATELLRRLERPVMAGLDPAIHQGSAIDARVKLGHDATVMHNGSWRYVLTFEPCNAPAFLTTPDSFTKLVTDAVEKKTGRRPALSTSGGTSDARFIRAYCPVIEFGAVGATAHMVDEHVAIADIEALTEIYAAILEDYFD